MLLQTFNLIVVSELFSRPGWWQICSGAGTCSAIASKLRSWNYPGQDWSDAASPFAIACSRRSRHGCWRMSWLGSGCVRGRSLVTQQQLTHLAELDTAKVAGDTVQILNRWQAAEELQAAIAELEEQQRQAVVNLFSLVGVSDD
ncbi:hypothetical protein KR51_00019130 [Rubidibacter lacunae KORDI 51-2]|uniref:Uncharacterized protein n=1 Tax=Rubidibacter lacunae KORDI 51-2 TaxID=582515 RepID=U5DI47_9CHRO|nr:hypothetical protein KR51_00019130 [Rubidibacter lacunae KORDI 51-2]